MCSSDLDFRRSTQACFPLFTHRGINYPPATGWSPHSRPGCQFYGNRRFLNVMDLQPMTTIPCPHSRKELRIASFPCVSFCVLNFHKRIFRFTPAIPYSPASQWLARSLFPLFPTNIKKRQENSCRFFIV